MRNALTAAGLLLALALAGCSDDGGGPRYEAVTCPDGTTMTAEEVELAMDEHEAGGHEHEHEAGGNGTGDGDLASKVCPIPPSVTLEGIPATLQAFKQASFRWSLDKGSLEHAHSMLTSIRYSTASVPDSDLTEVTKYPSELIKREHQDLPIAYNGNLTFSKVGPVYLRAYAEIQGEPYWSDEVALEITPVPPTGTVITIVHGPGDFLSPPDPSAASAVLGDAVQLDNQDVKAHTCSLENGPAQVEALAAEATALSNAVLLVVPGSYTFTCDEVQPQSFTVNVAVA